MSDVRQAIYRFTPQGHQDVERAIGTVSKAYQRAAADQRIAARRAVQTQREAAKETVGLERERLKSQERSAKERQRAEERAAKEQLRAVTRAERAKAVTERREQSVARKQTEQAGRSKAREADKWNRELQRVRDRAVRDEERTATQAARKQAQITAQAERQKQREVTKTIRQRERAFQRQREHAEATGGGTGGGLALGAARALGGGALTAGIAAVGAGAAVVGSSLREQLSLQALARDVSISSRDPGEKGVSIDGLQKSWNETAMRTPGQTAEGVGGAVKNFVTKTGDLDMATKMQETFAQVASATGADIKEIGSAAAELATKFDINTVEQMQEAFASMAFQGKKGAFELRDAAGEFARMGSAAQRYGMEKGSRGVKTLGGFAQLAMGATGNAAMASTAVDAMLSKLQTQSGVLKTASGGKVKVYSGTGKDKKTRDARDVVAEAVTHIGGNDVEKKNAKLKEIFDTEGLKALSPLIQEFSRALEAGEDPLTAIRAKIEDAAEAGGKWSEVMIDASAAQEATTAKFEAQWQALGLRVGEKLLPVAEQLAEKLLASDKGLDMLVDSAVSLGTAMSALVDFIKTIPGAAALFHKAPKSVDEAQKDLDNYDDLHGGPKEKKYDGIGPGVAEVDPRREKLAKALQEAESFESDMDAIKSGKLTGAERDAAIDKYGTGQGKVMGAIGWAISAPQKVLGPVAGFGAGSILNGETDTQAQMRGAASAADKQVRIDAKAAEDALIRGAQAIERASRTGSGRGDVFGGIGGKL